MRQVNLFRAEGDPVRGVMEEAVITIGAELPPTEGWSVGERRAFFISEAAALAEALWLALPGGTLDLLPAAIKARRIATERGPS